MDLIGHSLSACVIYGAHKNRNVHPRRPQVHGDADADQPHRRVRGGGPGQNRTQRMVIYYKFVGYLEIPSNLPAPNYKADLRQGVAVKCVSYKPTESARELFDEEYESVEEEQ